MDTSALRAAYDDLLDAAREAGPCPGRTDGAGWGTPTVLAHVAQNDLLILAHIRGALDDTHPAYDNSSVVDAGAMDSVAAAAGSFDELLETAAERAAEVVELAGSLDEGTLSRDHPTRIVSGDDVMVDGPLPLAGFLSAQANVHLPMHAAQIRAIAALEPS
jgi:hypothetical protein